MTEEFQFLECLIMSISRISLRKTLPELCRHQPKVVVAEDVAVAAEETVAVPEEVATLLILWLVVWEE